MQIQNALNNAIQIIVCLEYKLSLMARDVDRAEDMTGTSVRAPSWNCKNFLHAPGLRAG